METNSKFVPKYEAELPPKEWTSAELDFFVPNTAHEIQILSRAMNKAEVLQYYNNTYDALPERDQFFFDCNFNRGRTEAKSKAIDALFQQMKSKSGTNATMEFLTRFGAEWPEDEAGPRMGRGFNFKVVLDK